ncbi:MAG: phosphoadenylyl-sulfate reductase [Pseudomonadota bacterium]
MSGLERCGAAAADPAARAECLNRLHAGASAREVLEDAIRREFRGRIALVSSFGAESAALLHLVAQTDPTTPVLFLETGMLFPQTLAYQRDLAARLGLTDVRLIRPEAAEATAEDPEGALHRSDTDACCTLRKVRPLARALAPFDAWITGRKRFQGGRRAALELFEAEGDRVKLNPLAGWSAAEIRWHMERHGLPAHPLVAEGYPSLGCAPCTSRAGAGEDARAGRWRGDAKDECGIHFVDGKAVRGPAPRAA